ncbi:MAG: hypothetical protein KDB53_01345, partial [Planctomycetes bacterium]|nr:hypothetical protein [Planctomycetota bacterium]
DVSSQTSATFRNCTIFRDASAAASPVIKVTGLFVNITLENSIVWGASVTPLFVGGTSSPFTQPTTYLTNQNSIVENGFFGFNFLTTDPLFNDPATGDFHLQLGSPAINASLPVPVGTLDLDGTPRPLFGGPDIGCYEVSDVRANPLLAGNVPAASGIGTANSLSVNGFTGGALRTVQVALGASITIFLQTPPSAIGGSPFALFLRAGMPSPSEQFSIGGFGSMVFWPCPAAPGFQPILLTLADSYGLPGCMPLLPAGLTPWSSGALPGFFAPITTTIQGVVQTANGQHAITNGIVVQVQ